MYGKKTYAKEEKGYRQDLKRGKIVSLPRFTSSDDI